MCQKSCHLKETEGDYVYNKGKKLWQLETDRENSSENYCKKKNMPKKSGYLQYEFENTRLIGMTPQGVKGSFKQTIQWL